MKLKILRTASFCVLVFLAGCYTPPDFNSYYDTPEAPKNTQWAKMYWPDQYDSDSDYDSDYDYPISYPVSFVDRDIHGKIYMSTYEGDMLTLIDGEWNFSAFNIDNSYYSPTYHIKDLIVSEQYGKWVFSTAGAHNISPIWQFDDDLNFSNVTPYYFGYGYYSDIKTVHLFTYFDSYAFTDAGEIVIPSNYALLKQTTDITYNSNVGGLAFQVDTLKGAPWMDADGYGYFKTTVYDIPQGILFSVLNNGVYLYVNGQFINTGLDEISQLSHSYNGDVYDVDYSDVQIFKLAGSSWTVVDLPAEPGLLYQFYADSKGGQWLATSQGLFYKEDGHWEDVSVFVEYSSDYDSSLSGVCFIESADHVLYIMNTKAIYTYTLED